MSKQINEIIHTILQSKHPDWKIQLLSKWENIVGELKSRMAIAKVLDDTIFIGVYEVHWMQELYLLSPILMEKINKSLENPYIKNIRFKLIKEKIKKEKVEKKIKKSNKPRKMVKLSKQQTNALKKINDEDLRIALHSFLSRCLQP